MASATQFLLIYGTLVFSGLSGILVGSAIVDPYGLLRWISVTAFNQNKPMQRYHDRMVKAWDGQRSSADVVLLGTSRTQVGLNPEDSLFMKQGWRVYNYGLSGGTPYEALRYLQHAQAAKPVKLAVIGLDFLMFNDSQGARNPEFAEERLLVSNSDERQTFWFGHDLPAALLSRRAMTDSLKTVLKQKAPPYLMPNGQRHPDFMQALSTENKGAHGNFIFSERYYMNEFRCFVLKNRQGESKHLDDFRKLLVFAHSKKIDIKLYISPAHMRHLLTIRIMGLWSDYEDWLRELLRISEAELDAKGTKSGHNEFWNFAETNVYTTEDLPSQSSPAAMQWYWESSHYKESLGALVIKRILHAPDADQSFGSTLNFSQVEEAITRIRTELEAYATANPVAMRELEASRQEILTKKKGC